jgi:hypothetical protein
MEITELIDFSLLDGTALSLIYGHRKSVDLVLFSSKPFENNVIINALKKKFQDKFITEEKTPRFGFFLNEVKVDIVRQKYSIC